MKPLGTNDPRVISVYRLLGVLGGGGMGRVYLGRSRAGRHVAIKVIRPELAEDPVFRRRFAREVAAARAVNPLYTAAVIDADTEAQAPWLATTYIDGPSLEDLVTEHSPLPPDAVLTLAAGLAEALHSMHQVGLVHRDLKPGNVLLDDTGPHIIDFGISMTANSTRLTTSMIVGTPSYMAPERIQGDEGGPPGDIFSLGATLVFAATGKTLVSEGTMFQQISQIANGTFQINDVPGPIRPLVTRCLSHRPTDRPTAEEIGRILAGSQVGMPETGWYRDEDSLVPAWQPYTANLPQLPDDQPPARLTRRRMLALSGVAGVAAAGGAIATGVALSTGRGGDRVGADGPGTTVASVVSPGAVRWQVVVDAGVADSNAGDGLAVSGNGLLISAAAGEVVTVDANGNLGWHRSVTQRQPIIWQWGDDLAVTDQERIVLLSGSDGLTQATIDAADIERTASRRDNPDSLPVQIGRLAFSGDLAFVHLGTATVAYNRRGERQWRRARPTAGNGGRTTSGQPLTADGRFLVTHDATTSADGLRRIVDINLLDVRTGEARWAAPLRNVVDLDLVQRRPAGPQASGRPGPGTGQIPQADRAGQDGPDPVWNRSSVLFAGEFLVARDSRRLRLIRLADGSLVWEKSLPAPVVSVVTIADRIIVGSDQVYAFVTESGAFSWQKNERGGRLAVSEDGEKLYVIGDSAMAAYDVLGNLRWSEARPSVLGPVGSTRFLVRGTTGIIAGPPAARGVDVVGVVLETPS